MSTSCYLRPDVSHLGNSVCLMVVTWMSTEFAIQQLFTCSSVFLTWGPLAVLCYGPRATLIRHYFHSIMHTASLKSVFAKLLWKLFLNQKEAIPQSKRSLKIAASWWNKQCDIAVKNKEHAFNRMKRTWLSRDIIIFKRCRVKARRVLLEAKSTSWQQFCTSLTSNTNLSKVQKVIESFFGNRSPYFIPTVRAQGISAKNNQHKSNILASHFALSSSSLNYPLRFVNVFLSNKTGLCNMHCPMRHPLIQRLNQAFSLKRTSLRCPRHEKHYIRTRQYLLRNV